MAEVLIGPAIDALSQQAISLIQKLWGLGSAAQEYKESCKVLSDLVTLLNDHKDIKNRSYELMRWYQDLKYLVEDLEEVVADLKEDMERGILRRVKKVLKPNSTLKDELKAITTKIQQDVYDRENRLRHVEMKEDSMIKPGPTPSDLKIFGRESKKEAIFNLLKTPNSYSECVYDFISIVGIGGIGKTTLAQHVYCDDNVSSFPVRAWIHVSTEPNLCRIYRSIIEQQLRSQCLIEDSFAMEEKLREVLKGKKFLIVIDDYRNESVQDFNALRAPFMAAAPGSKFIVTTQNRAVAKRFTAEESIIDLGWLSKEDSWSLFCSRSRLADNSTSNLVTIAKEICEKCDGFPLALSVMKGLLSGIDDEAGWRVVLDDLVSGKIKDFRSIIERSYWNLPYHMQTYFSFCIIFTKDHSFRRETIVNLWKYAGIVKCQNHSREEDEGGRWFDELVSRSLLTCNPSGYVIHDIVRNVIMKCGGEKYGRWEDDVGSWEKIRHVSISKQITAKALDNLKSVPKEKVRLKTLFIDCEYYENDDMKASILKWKHLRVLEIQNLKVSKCLKYIRQMNKLRKLELRNIYDLKKVPVISKLNNLTEVGIISCNSLTGPLPANLGSLIHLKRFAIHNCNKLSGHIPIELGSLKALSYISFYNNSELTGPIPSELGGLSALKYLTISWCGVTGPIPKQLGELTALEYFRIDGCNGLTESLPPELGGLIALKILSLRNCQGLTGNIPSELGGLISLTSLSFFGCIGLTGHIPPELGNLINLKYLQFFDCNGLTGHIPLELGGLTALEKLFFSGCVALNQRIPTELGNLAALTSLYFLECRELEGPIPPQLGELTALESLIFCGCKELTGSIPPQLGGLTALKELSFTNCSKLTGHIPSELGGLTSLITLCFRDCGELTGHIPPQLGSLRALTDLQFFGCSQLTGSIPSQLGSLTALKYLSFSGCSQLTGSIPLELSRLTALNYLSFSGCNKLAGHIPEEMGDSTPQIYR